jgi:predicted acylesterase/phospholipase RssA
MIIPPYRITLSGGGLKGIAHIGALEVLAEHKLLGAVREYIGISAGALCTFCLCIGCSLTELRMIISLLDFGKIRDLEPETILSFPDTFGFDTGANLEKLLMVILRARRIDPHVTFAQLDALKLGPRLRIIATNMNTCMPEDFGPATTPDAEVIMAVRASMSIPLYFAPVRDPTTGHLYVDGGVICSSPFKFLTAEERRHTLSITFGESHKPREDIPTLPDFLYQLYFTTDYRSNRSLTRRWKPNILEIQCGKMNVVMFETTQERKIELMDAGRKAAEEFLLGTSHQPPARRFSVG